MARIKSLDTHQRPPESIKSIYKFYQTLKLDDLDVNPDILDFRRGLSLEQKEQCKQVDTMLSETVRDACIRFGHPRQDDDDDDYAHFVDTPIFEHGKVPGLCFVPALMPRQTQKDLLSRLMHQALADERHKTNIHLHYRIPYQSAQPSHSVENVDGCSPGEAPASYRSFFNMSPETSEPFPPLDPTTHKPLTAAQFLRRKLRWMTLGGQYNWTTKMYPNETHPPFPADIATLIHSLFPDMSPEAAIVNLYTPGDTLSVHRDVSEDSDRGLVSLSLGCDGIFVAGFGADDEDEENGVRFPAGQLAVRLRSGDALYMSGSARFAWHGVPKVIANTCPQWLRSWPGGRSDSSCPDNDDNETYRSWSGWMADKRINMNIRQIKDF